MSSMELEQALTALAVRFAGEVVTLIRRSNPNALARLGKTPSRVPSGTYRRSSDEIQSAARRIVAVVRTQRSGATAEMIKAKLGLPTGRSSAKLFAKPLSVALDKGWLRKRGTRRQTRYFVP